VALQTFLEVVFALSAVAVSAFTLTWGRIVRAGRRPSTSAGQLIVVFGAEAIDGRPSGELEARLRFAATLYQAGRAPLILCSGGHPGPQSEPNVMRRTLVGWGVPAACILIDEEGSSTRRTVSAARRMCTRGAGRLLLVSSPYHVHRIGREARRQSLAAVCCPAPTTPIMRNGPAFRRQMLREVAATWWYATPEWLRRALRPGAPPAPGPQDAAALARATRAVPTAALAGVLADGE
jgi:uncharacterized SAM-binding protein YcdF (DUF218 family)